MAKGLQVRCMSGLTGGWTAAAWLAGLTTAVTLFAWPGVSIAEGPVSAARFSITIDGYEIASFSEAVLGSAIVVDGSGTARRLSTRATATFKRPQTSSRGLWVWHESALLKRTPPGQDMEVVAYGTAGQPVARYKLTAAWPEAVEINGLKAGASEVLMESVTIIAERLQRVE